MSGVSDPLTPMDIDREGPSSPPINTSAAFPESDGGASEDHANGETSPVPPPHSVNPTTSPPPKPFIDPEICKAVGNKYFKSKDYQRAIQEYSKGESGSMWQANVPTIRPCVITADLYKLLVWSHSRLPTSPTVPPR